MQDASEPDVGKVGTGVFASLDLQILNLISLAQVPVQSEFVKRGSKSENLNDI
jgi:hypothetical protein